MEVLQLDLRDGCDAAFFFPSSASMFDFSPLINQIQIQFKLQDVLNVAFKCINIKEGMKNIENVQNNVLNF